MNIVYVSRSEWGASQATEDFITARYSALPEEKTTIQVHHTASIDGNDSTPNRWSYDEAVRYMRSLQTARPELGPLPYSENYAISEDLSTVWLFEGRGILKVGAHTAGHNRDGYGAGVFGNFDKKDLDAADGLVSAIEQRSTELRDTMLPNLGSVLSPNGWVAWGHRDSAPKSCPGNYLYPMLASFQLGGGDDMPLSQEDLNKIADAVWYRLITHPVTGVQRGAQALLADAVRYAAVAAAQETPPPGAPTTDPGNPL